MRLKRIANVSVAVLVTVAMAVPGIGCVTTKKVAHTATFGLVGDEEGIQQAQEEKQAKKQAEQDREERKKAEKRERKRARKEAEQQEKADKKARKQAKKESRDSESEKPTEERGFWNKATFGMVGGGDKPDERSEAAALDEKPSKKEAKQARKQEKRAAEQAKKAEKRERKEARKQEERDQEAAKKQAKQERKEAKAAGDEAEKEERGFWNKATLGLVGGGKAEEERQAEAAPEPSEKASKKEEKRARKEARKQEERDQEAAKKQAKQERKEAKAQEKSEEKQQEPEKEKRGFWSKATFGLVGGGNEEAEEAQDTAAQPEQAATASSETGVKEAESVDVAQAEEQAPPVDPPTPIRGEHKGLAKLSFKTAVTKEGETRSGLAKLVASRRTYSEHGYGICDLGEVRIAVKGMTFPGEARAGGVVIQSDERGVAAGKSGRGNEAFAFQYEKGVTTCVFGTVQFTIGKGVLTVDGQDVSMVSGRKLVVLNESGKVDAVYNIGK